MCSSLVTEPPEVVVPFGGVVDVAETGNVKTYGFSSLVIGVFKAFKACKILKRLEVGSGQLQRTGPWTWPAARGS